MRKFIVIFAMLMLVALGAYAAPGDPIGDIIETDILTYINNKPINSYNIRGQTVVIVEELCNNDTGVHYGFTSTYDDSTRTLTLDSDFTTGNANATVKRGVNGGVVGTVIETDIRVFFNGIEITGYNIRGKTAICVEEMGAYTKDEHNAQFGYSKYLCNAVWLEDTRELFLNTFLQEKSFFANYPSKKLKFELHDNQLSCTFDQLNPFLTTFSVSLSEEFKNDCYKIKPVYFGGEVVGQMITVPSGIALLTMNEAKTYTKTAKLEKVLSFGEAVSYVKNNFKIVTELEDENAIIYLAEKDGVHYLLFALKEGGLVCDGKYDGSYSSVSLSSKNKVPTLTLKNNSFSGSIPVSTAGYSFRTDYSNYISGTISDSDRLSTRVGTAEVFFDGNTYNIGAVLPYAYNQDLMVDLEDMCAMLNIDFFVQSGIFYITTNQSKYELSAVFDVDSGKLPASVNTLSSSTVYVDGKPVSLTYTDSDMSEKSAFPYLIKGRVYIPFKLFENICR